MGERGELLLPAVDYQERLERLYAEQPDFVAAAHPLQRGAVVHHAAASRTSRSAARKLNWGVPVAVGRRARSSTSGSTRCSTTTRRSSTAPGEDVTDRFWPPDFHLIGKDILKFHAVFWPAMLMAGEVELPRHLFIHGYLLMQGEKMSKTLGNVLDPFQVIDVYGVDALRYYCFREVSFGQDGSVSTEGFEARYNTELANDYGNLASRTIAMIDRYRDGACRGRRRRPSWRATSTASRETVRGHLDRAELSARAGGDLESGVRRLNQYVEQQAPWNLAKDEATPERWTRRSTAWRRGCAS